MVIDMAGRGSYIDAVCSPTSFMPQQTGVLNTLTQAGQAIWQMTQQKFQDVVQGVSNIIQAREFVKQTGSFHADDCPYYINSFEGILNAGTTMQHYVMAHPVMQVAYKKGYDVYPDYVMPAHAHVYQAYAEQNIVQFGPDSEYFSEVFTHGYDDIPEPTKAEQHAIWMTHQYIQENLAGKIRSLLLDNLIE